MDRLQGKRPEAQLLPLDSNKLRQVANVVVHLQGMLKDLEGNVKIIAEERRILKELLLAYIEENG